MQHHASSGSERIEEAFRRAASEGRPALMPFLTAGDPDLATTASLSAQNFVHFESPHVHPLERTPDGTRLLAVNTADGRLEVFDVTGAGDTVIATMAALVGAGLSLRDAMPLANKAGGIVVGKLGTAVVTREELSAALA